MIDNMGVANSSDLFAVFRTFEISLTKTIIISDRFQDFTSEVLCIINPTPIEDIPNISNVWEPFVDESRKTITHSPNCLQILASREDIFDAVISNAFKSFRDARIILSRRGSGSSRRSQRDIANKRNDVRECIYRQLLGNVDSEKTSLLTSLRLTENQMKACQTHQLTLMKRLEIAKERLKDIENIPEGEEKEMMIDKAVTGVMKLYESGAYANIEFAPDSIKGLTPPIWIKENDMYYYMGTYLVSIPYNSTGIRITSVIEPPGKETSNPHPHVNVDGGPCLGNISRAIPQYLKCGSYGVIFAILKEYLESCNSGDTYADIDHWKAYAKKEDLKLLPDGRVDTSAS